jgi:hypothetical protein
MKVDVECDDLIQQLAVDVVIMQKICYGYNGSWTDYISRLSDYAQKNEVNKAGGEAGIKEKKPESDPVGLFALHFIVDEAIQEEKIAKSSEDEEMMDVLISIFIEFEIEYWRKDLDLARGAITKKDLDSILRKAEKKGFVSSRNEAGKKLYVLKPPNTKIL